MNILNHYLLRIEQDVGLGWHESEWKVGRSEKQREWYNELVDR